MQLAIGSLLILVQDADRHVQFGVFDSWIKSLRRLGQYIPDVIPIHQPLLLSAIGVSSMKVGIEECDPP